MPCSTGKGSPGWRRGRRREAGDAGFDVLIACAFNYEAHATEFSKLGRIPALKARMNADLHMSDDLKNTGKGNLFVIFGEPDIILLPDEDGQVRVKINGVDVFHPNTGEVRSDGAEGIACWFIDTDYNVLGVRPNSKFFLAVRRRVCSYRGYATTITPPAPRRYLALHGQRQRASGHRMR